MNEKTASFLRRCSKYKIKAVAICESSPLVPVSTEFWGGAVPQSVFAEGEDKDGWPLIWAVCDKEGLGGGCGNSGQRQLPSGHGLDKGVYKKAPRKWVKVESV